MPSPHKRSFAAEELERRKTRKHALRWIIPGVLIVLFAAAGAAFFLLRVKKEQPAESPVPAGEKITIAVLPFEDLSDARDQEIFGKGVAESILNKLTNIERLRVFARTSSFEFKNQNRPILDQCREHGIDWLLEGSVRKSGARLRITAQLVRVSDQSHVFSQEYDKEIRDVFDIQTEIAVAVLNELKFTLMGKEREAIAKRYTKDPDAYELFIKGKESGRDLKAVGLYEQAIEKDPDFTLAYAMLAQVYNRRGYHYWEKDHIMPHEAYPKAKEYALKALELDEKLCEAYAELAWTSLYYDWDWSATETYLKKALELNPGYAEAHHYYRDFYIVMGRWDEAIAEIYEARKYDPVQYQNTHYLATTLILAQRYDEALKEVERRMKLDPDYRLTLWNLRGVYRGKGDYKKMAEISSKMVVQTGFPELLKNFYIGEDNALLGNHDEAIKYIRLLEENYKQHSAGEMAIAGLYMLIGDFDKTFEWLEKAYEARVSRLTDIYSFPEWDPIRSDPRYKELIKKMGFPEK